MDAATALPTTPAAPTPVSPERMKKIDNAAKSYETSFLSVMLGTMLPDTSSTSSGGFGGGEGEAAFKSFLTDAMAKAMVKRGGIGLAPKLTTELLKLQGAH